MRTVEVLRSYRMSAASFAPSTSAPDLLCGLTKPGAYEEGDSGRPRPPRLVGLPESPLAFLQSVLSPWTPFPVPVRALVSRYHFSSLSILILLEANIHAIPTRHFSVGLSSPL